MKPDLFKEADKIWKRLANESSEEELKFELEVYRGFLNFFQVGDYYYYIFNVKDVVFDFMSHNITQVLGYSKEEITVPFFINLIHPEDQPWFLNFESRVTDFFKSLSKEQIPNYKVHYDYRIQKKNGEYIRVLQQVVTIQSAENNVVLRTFGVHTDITHIKKYGSPVLSFIGLNGEPSYLNIDVKKHFITSISAFTPRELEILKLLAEGMSSSDISSFLYISKQTVETHRKNLIKKSGCTNMISLTAGAIKNGWIRYRIIFSYVHAKKIDYSFETVSLQSIHHI